MMFQYFVCPICNCIIKIKKNKHFFLIYCFSRTYSFTRFLLFCKNQTTRRTSRTSSCWISSIKIRATQIFIKDEITGRVDILQCIFEKIVKIELKIKSQDQKKTVFGKFLQKQLCFFGYCHFNLNFYSIFSKMRQSISTLPVIFFM